MTSKNDITGATIKTKPASEQYTNNYDLIFRKKTEVMTPEALMSELRHLVSLCNDYQWGTVHHRLSQLVAQFSGGNWKPKWDESRIDIIGRNGNEGLHYEETEDKQSEEEQPWL